ncbi:MAG: 50S ribosome-binding GTPase [Candidatus Heimdallarchaeota archaeon]|nr:50S ribosome-binding GTPase [Candidatus Heimdallarchaeota archaeon]MBY8994311.1 50S ribosome-binding GTPase [Candidatus Heimdallarchaeota archaeon]
MSLLRKIIKSRDSKDKESEEEKKTIAIIGLDGAGKTTIIGRLLKSDYSLTRPTFGINIEIYKYRSLEFIVYDLGGQTPLRETLWEKFVSSADGLVFVLDSTDRRRFDIAAKEFNNALGYNDRAPVLFLSNKIDLENAASADEVLEVIDFGELTRKQRKYNFARCSALTGELLFESWDWLTLELSEDQNLPTTNVKIYGGYIFESDGTEIETTLLGKPKTQSKYATLFKKGNKEIKKYLRIMENYDRAETLMQIDEKQLVLTKNGPLVLSIIIGENDPAARAIQIMKNLHKNIERKFETDKSECLKQLLEDNYPLDIIKD